MKFNAKSAGVTSMLLIMAFIGTIAPTLFYQTYGSVSSLGSSVILPLLTQLLQFELICDGCPTWDGSSLTKPWVCQHCYYKHPDPVDDPFYQSTVKSLMFFCAVILLFVSHRVPGTEHEYSQHSSSRISLVYGSRCVRTPVKFGRTLSSSFTHMRWPHRAAVCRYTIACFLESPAFTISRVSLPPTRLKVMYPHVARPRFLARTSLPRTRKHHN